MKKIVALVLVVMMSLCAVSAMAELKLGQIQAAAHGTKCFAVVTVVMEDDKIAIAYIDEYQAMPKDSTVSVPNAAAMFGEEATSLLASKRVNAAYYSNNMATKAASTVALDVNYDAIQAHVVGMTIAELEAEIAAFNGEKTAAVDAVAGCTLADTLGYMTAILEAAKAAK